MSAKGAVPESILKKRKRDEDWAAKKAAASADQKKRSKDGRKDIFKRAEQYVKEYRDKVRGISRRVSCRLASGPWFMLLIDKVDLLKWWTISIQ